MCESSDKFNPLFIYQYRLNMYTPKVWIANIMLKLTKNSYIYCAGCAENEKRLMIAIHVLVFRI